MTEIVIPLEREPLYDLDGDLLAWHCRIVVDDRVWKMSRMTLVKRPLLSDSDTQEE